MTFDEFKRSQTGAAIGAILSRRGAVERMIAVSREDRPAVEAVGADIARAVGRLDDTERKFVGRWVREILAPRGWVPDRKGRVAVGRLFNRGTIYRRKLATPSNLSAIARLDAARELVKALAEKPMASSQLIAERHRAAAEEH